MRIFVAGATGAIGRFLVPLLVQAGHEVVGTTRKIDGVAQLRSQGVTPIQLDVFDGPQIRDAVLAAAPEVIFHQLTSLSGGSSLDNARMRVEGTRNLVDAAHAAGVRTMVAQSIAWSYEPGNEPAVEDTSLHVHAEGARATTVGGVLALEEAVGEIDQHVVLRLGTLYGPGTWYAPNDYMDKQLHDDAVAANDGVSSFVHVADAARAAVMALAWPSGPVNIVDDEPAAAAEWVPQLAQALGAPVPNRVTGREAWERGAKNMLARQLGWAPSFSSWRDGFGRQMSS